MLSLEERILKRKEAQARAHKKWRDSEKGRAYYDKRRLARCVKETDGQTDKPEQG